MEERKKKKGKKNIWWNHVAFDFFSLSFIIRPSFAAAARAADATDFAAPDLPAAAVTHTEAVTQPRSQ